MTGSGAGPSVNGAACALAGRRHGKGVCQSGRRASIGTRVEIRSRRTTGNQVAEANGVCSCRPKGKDHRRQRKQSHDRNRTSRARGVSALSLVLGHVAGAVGSLGEDPVPLALAGAVQMQVMGDEALENQKQRHQPAQRDALASCVETANWYRTPSHGKSKTTGVIPGQRDFAGPGLAEGHFAQRVTHSGRSVSEQGNRARTFRLSVAGAAKRKRRALRPGVPVGTFSGLRRTARP